MDAEDIDGLRDAINASSTDLVYDLNGDGVVSRNPSIFDDTDELVLIILNTYYGDSNLDGAFNSGDITFAFQGGEYDDGDNNNSGWAEGDWNGDGDFDSSDFSFAFGEGGYDQPNRGGGAFATHQTIIGYTGRPLDLVTGLQNNLNRWYDARTGRWISEDPIGFAAGDANLYRYVGNGPVDAVDPTGLEWEMTPLDRGKARRRVCNSSPDDTVRDLAEQLHLTPEESGKWLKNDGNRGMVVASPDQRIGKAGQRYTIPNVAVEYRMANNWPTSIPAVNVAMIHAGLMASQAVVAGHKLVTVTDGTFESFEKHFEDDDTIMFFFAGHGTADSQNGTKSLTLTNGWLQPLITAQPYQVGRPFGLSYLGLYACYSANNAARPGAPARYWSEFVSVTGTFEGGDGWIYAWSAFESWTGPAPPAGM